MRVEVLTSAALEATLDDVARLRIAVFAEWPYLYNGDVAYEARYLQTYKDAPKAILVGAFDGEHLVGASTGTPLSGHAEEFSAAFTDTDVDLSDVFYCAESVLLPEYRGAGVGNRFFDLREAHARRLGYSKCCFCGVVRPSDHPARPARYTPLDGFWRRRGYAPLKGVIAKFHWRDLGQGGETPKPLQFWIKDL